MNGFDTVLLSLSYVFKYFVENNKFYNGRISTKSKVIEVFLTYKLNIVHMSLNVAYDLNVSI